MEDDNKLSYFFLGLGLGVAVGVLFAPKSGAETREFLRNKAEEGTDYVKQQADNAERDRRRSAGTQQADHSEAEGQSGLRG